MKILPSRLAHIACPLAAILCLTLPFRAMLAQDSTKPATHSAACKPDTSEPTEADIAFARGNYKKSADLYAIAVTKDPADSVSHHLQIASLIADSKLSEAIKNTEAWTTAEPKNPYAILSAGEIRSSEGDWPEFYALVLKAMALDACMPTGYEDLAAFESLSGYRATARKHLSLAHQLAPNNQLIRLEWIESLNEAEAIARSKDYLQDSKVIDDKKRKKLVAQFDKRAALSEDGCSLASIKGPAVIPMAPLYGDVVGIDHWGIEIAFNGKKRILQIDTGASGFTLTQSVGSGLGLTRIDNGRVGGIGDEGGTGVTLNRADSVRIGGLEFKNCTVEVLTKTGTLGGSTEIGQRMDNIDGLVGADIFSRYLVTLDYIKHEIRLEPLPQSPGNTATPTSLDPLGGSNDPDWINVDRYIAPSMNNWTKIYRSDHMLIMPTRLSSGAVAGRNRLFIVDTGADSNLIDINVAKELTKTNENELISFEGLSGKVDKVFETGKFTADFAGLRLPVTGMDSMDLSKFGGVSGFLGYPTLQQLVMHIDYRDNLVLFEAPNGRSTAAPSKKK